MLSLQNEISRERPIGYSSRKLKGGEPILYAFECALLERETSKAYVYTAVNLTTGQSEMLSRRVSPLTTSGVEAMADRMRRSHVAGAGRLQADRPVEQSINRNKAQEILSAVFKKILPKFGYTVRKEQV